MNERERRRPSDRFVLTAAGQRAIDDAAIAAGVPSVDLMESAGTSASDWIRERIDPELVVVLVGPGGNGGDGLVVARLLSEAGARVRILLMPEADRLSGATKEMWQRLPSAVEIEHDPGRLDDLLRDAECVVDALFGTGMTRALEGSYRNVVDQVNAARAHVISLDLPSGLPSDRGALLGPAIQASITLAMAFLKSAHLLFPAAEHCGNVAVVSVDYPEHTLQGIVPLARVPELEGIAARLPARTPTGHKGTFGRVLVLAGSHEMPGAAILTCRAALRSGAGMVFLAVPESVRDLLESALPEVITLPMPDEDGTLAGIDRPQFADVLASADVLAAGPGLGRREETLHAVRAAVERFNGPVILDADAIYAFAGNLEVLRRSGRRLLLTPHPGEFAALAGGSADDGTPESARAFAARHRIHILLKGRPTTIAAPDGELWLNPTGNTGLATGGSGDVLTGMISALVAGGAALADAAIVGAYLHGRAAEVFSADRSERSLTPSDVIELLPIVFREAEREARGEDRRWISS